MPRTDWAVVDESTSIAHPLTDTRRQVRRPDDDVALPPCPWPTSVEDRKCRQVSARSAGNCRPVSTRAARRSGAVPGAVLRTIMAIDRDDVVAGRCRGRTAGGGRSYFRGTVCLFVWQVSVACNRARRSPVGGGNPSATRASARDAAIGPDRQSATCGAPVRLKSRLRIVGAGDIARFSSVPACVGAGEHFRPRFIQFGSLRRTEEFLLAYLAAVVAACRNRRSRCPADRGRPKAFLRAEARRLSRGSRD